MAPKKAPSKREHDPRAGTSSHGSSKLGTNETNNEEFPLGDHDDESVGVNEGAVDSVWTRPSIFHLLSEGTNEAASMPYAQVTDKPSLKPSAQEKDSNEHALRERNPSGSILSTSSRFGIAHSNKRPASRLQNAQLSKHNQSNTRLIEMARPFWKRVAS